MQQISFDGGYFHAAGHTAGQFWVCTRSAHFAYAPGQTYTLRFADGFTRTVPAPDPVPGSRWNHERPSYLDHPKCPGLSIGWFSHVSSTAVHVRTGKRFKIAKTHRPIPPADAPGTYDRNAWELYRTADDKWTKTHVTPHRTGVTNMLRFAYTDRYVVMTGSEAVGSAAFLMGPTRAAAVLATKNLRTGHVVIHDRVGESRVLRFPERGNPLVVCTAPDGLTFLAAARGLACVYDTDPG